MAKVGIVTAMETELWPLIRNWRVNSAEHGGRRYKFFESNSAIAVCGGIGREPGIRAAQAVMARARPEVLIAAGLAGALRLEWTLGRTMVAEAVIDAASGRRYATEFGDGLVVSSVEIAGARHKRELAACFHADLVDMEGAAVAEVAEAHGIAFLAAKAVSDEVDFDFPPLQPFVNKDGRFRALRFTLAAIVRPWWWWKIWRLHRNTSRAAEALADELRRLIAQVVSGRVTQESRRRT